MTDRYEKVGKVLKLIKGGGGEPPNCRQCDDAKPVLIRLLGDLASCIRLLSGRSKKNPSEET